MSRAAAPADREPLPIDVHYHKLLHWLVDRRAIPSKWALHLSTARTLTRTALSVTPPPLQAALSIAPLSPHHHLPAATVRSILRRLTSPSPPDAAAHHPALPSLPAPDKDLLGRYKSPLLRAWAAAASAFDKHATHLADAAQLLVQNTNHEAPALKAVIARLNRTLSDSARRESQLIRAAADARARLQRTLLQHHLNDRDDAHTDFHAQLAARVQAQLPQLLQSAVQRARDAPFRRCVQYYRAFAAYVSAADEPACDVCAVIERVMSDDMHALTELRKRPQSPHHAALDAERLVAEEHAAACAAESDAPTGEAVDWGIELGDSGVQLGDERDTDAAPAAEIDWSATMGVVNDVSTERPDEQTNGAPSLADATFREQYVNELTELLAFLRQRRAEMRRLASSDAALALQQGARVRGDVVNGADADAVDGMCETVQAVLEAIHGDETRKMVALWSNDSLLARTAKSVLEMKMGAQRAAGAIDACRRQRAAAAAQLREEVARLERVAEQTRHVKSHAERELRELFSGRAVNIIGDVNVLCATKRGAVK